MKKHFGKKVILLIGTRPEAIKLAPVIREIKKNSILEAVVCSTGQHREMLEAALDDFSIKPDLRLDVMCDDQALSGLTSRLFAAVGDAVARVKPDFMLVQGDTTTAMVGALCAFYSKIPLGHVEAGLRTGNMAAPFPEEMNRRIISLAAKVHFAPTEESAGNLLKEGISPESVLVTGNTVVDALLYMRDVVTRKPPCFPESSFPARLSALLRENKPYTLITGHRRENFGEGFQNICQAIATLAELHPDHHFIYPVHLNPNVRKVVNSALASYENVMLIPPCSYPQFVALLNDAMFILSDSGGIQEEAPSLGKKVLVMRETTERPEGVKAGACHLVGTNPELIVEMAEKLFAAGGDAACAVNPYGDGKAAARIACAVARVCEIS